MATPTKTVLVVGATGALGGLTVDRLLSKGHKVKALVRPSSHGSAALTAKGVELAVGDVLNPATLASALGGAGGVSAVVVAAAHFATAPKKTSTNEADIEGGRNLVDAAKAANVSVFVLLSNVGADHPAAANVAHFGTHLRVEEYLAQQGVPFVSLRTSAFLSTTNFRDLVSKYQINTLWGVDVKFSLVGFDTVARALADAVDVPAAIGRKIDLGTDRPVTAVELGKAFSDLLNGRHIGVGRVPPWLFTVIGWFIGFLYDVKIMGEFFDTGHFVADTTAQAELFGPVQTVEEACQSFITAHNLKSK